MSLGTLTVVHSDKVSPVSGWLNGISLDAGLYNETRSSRHEARATEVVREETPKNIPQSLTLSLSSSVSIFFSSFNSTFHHPDFFLFLILPSSGLHITRCVTNCSLCRSKQLRGISWLGVLQRTVCQRPLTHSLKG